MDSSQVPNIAVLGDGQMGLVCAAILGSREDACRATLWGYEPTGMQRLAQERVSARLPLLRLPDAVRVTESDSAALSNADLIVSAVPTQFSRSVWERVKRWVPARAAVVSVAKGLENGTLLRPTQIIADVLGERTGPNGSGRSYGVLSGPTIAPELARCLPATMVSASADPALARLVQQLFSTSWMRVYTADDVVGVEIAGAVKNVIAIAAGILDGLHAGFNAKSALLARGLAEIARLGAALGAKPETFFGLAGVGDLATTCFSPEGRNRSCGEALGKGESLASYLARTESVVEGVSTASAVVELARRTGVEMPIVVAVDAVLHEGVDPLEAIQRLMSRELKAERVG